MHKLLCILKEGLLNKGIQLSMTFFHRKREFIADLLRKQ